MWGSNSRPPHIVTKIKSTLDMKNEVVVTSGMDKGKSMAKQSSKKDCWARHEVASLMNMTRDVERE